MIMVYKDKDRQREANREQMRRARAKGNTGNTGNTPCIADAELKQIGKDMLEDARKIMMKREGMTSKQLDQATERLIKRTQPERSYIGAVPEVPGLTTIAKPERTAKGNIRVSKPGDADYEPQCETTRAFIESRPKTTRFPTHKRGLDIKVFEDLPPDVQETIDRMSVVDGKTDQTAKANRAAIAIHYQHLFPDRYYSTGVSNG